MFADDTKIFRSTQNHTDSLQLQSDINKLFEWSKVWQLQFDVSKCYHLHLGQLPISSIDLVNDLGVFIDNKLKFNHHSSVIYSCKGESCNSSNTHLLSVWMLKCLFPFINLLLGLY